MMSVFCCSCLEVRSSNECGKSLKNATYRCVSFMHSLDSFSCCVKYFISSWTLLYFPGSEAEELHDLRRWDVRSFRWATIQNFSHTPVHLIIFNIFLKQVESESRRSEWWSTWPTTSSRASRTSKAAPAEQCWPDNLESRRQVSRWKNVQVGADQQRVAILTLTHQLCHV